MKHDKLSHDGNDSPTKNQKSSLAFTMPLPQTIMSPSSGQRSPRSSGRRQKGSSRSICRFTMWMGLLLTAYQVVWTFYFAGVNIPDVEIDKETGAKRIRRRPHLLKKRDHRQGKDVPTTPLDGILESHLTLMNINIPRSGLHRGTGETASQKYAGVFGTFCHIAWQMQDDDPTSVPNFADLRDESPLCLATRVKVDLWEMTRMAEQYDLRNHTFAATTPKKGQGPHPPTAALFHQSRCGSTVISNTLATYLPKHTRVFAEAPAPMAALMACEGVKNCDTEAQDALVRDIFYLMGRSPGPVLPQHVFYKFQSTASLYLDVFRRAMPEIPYMFAYRHPVEILMSHFKNYQRGNPVGANFMPQCLRNRGTPRQPKLLQDLVAAKGRTIADLGTEEYCAAHLAALGESMLQDMQSKKTTGAEVTGDGPSNWLINYEELPYKTWEVVLPELLPAEVIDDEQRSHMHDAAKRYSKGPMAGEHWVEDSTLKQGTAPETIQQAAALFMHPVYERLETLRKKKFNNR